MLRQERHTSFSTPGNKARAGATFGWPECCYERVKGEHHQCIVRLLLAPLTVSREQLRPSVRMMNKSALRGHVFSLQVLKQYSHSLPLYAIVCILAIATVHRTRWKMNSFGHGSGGRLTLSDQSPGQASSRYWSCC